jgi:hypothetical protein
MAYNRATAGHTGTWYQEQMSMINASSAAELNELCDGFDMNFQNVASSIKTDSGINIMKDAKKMLDHPEIMQEYKTMLLDPIVNEIKEAAADTQDPGEKIHLESVAMQLDQAWDKNLEAFLVQESYNTSTYLPLATLDFPALIKQYIRFLGKDIIPVQNASSTNIEQRIFIKYLVNNQTGEEYEVPKVYWQREADGTPTWKKLWNAGKGVRINDHDPISFADIKNATNKKYDMFNHLLQDNDQPYPVQGQAGCFDKTLRSRLSYDFNIQYISLDASTEESYDLLTSATAPTDWPTDSTPSTKYFKNTGTAEAPVYAGVTSTDVYAANTYYEYHAATTGTKKVKLPGAGIAIELQTGGVFLNGGITEDMVLPVVKDWDATPGADNSKYNLPTGETVTGISDMLSGRVDFVKGTLTASVCGDKITGLYVSGRISNETNLRTIGFREYPEIRKFLISDGCRFQLPFTVEDFAEANASLNFNLYNRLVQELVINQEMFEDESILEYLDEEFDKYNGYDSDVWALESYTHTEYADLDPTAISNSFAGDPWEYRTNAVDNAVNSVIYELCDRGKLENLGFVIYANPKACRLLNKFVTWTVKKGTEIGGVQMNHSFGILTDSDLPIRVVASNRVDAYTLIPAYQTNEGADPETDFSKEYFFKIVAYPMDKFHISYKHLRFARHLTNSPENAGYADINNPGGQAVLITTSAQYKTISIQGIQGRVICKNTVLVPDIKAGLVKKTNAVAAGTDSGTVKP